MQACRQQLDADARWVRTGSPLPQYPKNFIFDEYGPEHTDRCGDLADNPDWTAFCSSCLIRNGLRW